MWSAIWSFIFDTKMIKTTAASAIGSGAVVIGLMDAKISEVKTIAEKDKEYIVNYVENKQENFIDKLNTIEKKRDIIDDRLWNINKKLKE